jgi:hypothetical protein
MAKKKVSKFDKLEQVIEKSVGSEWCIVDTNNFFSYQSNKMKIDESVSQYIVLNKPKKSDKGVINNWSNDAQMSNILVVDSGDEFRFFDESFEEIDGSKVDFIN